MTNIPISMALEHYDRHVPFFEGSVGVEGVDLKPLHVGQSAPSLLGAGRHERMLDHGEWEVAELSLSSYLVARDQGLPFSAIPVFPRRLFSLSQMWVNRASGIRGPKDLEGRRVALNTYQTTLSVLAKGDLAQVYGVDWKSITWVTSRDESVPVELPPDVKLERTRNGKTISEAVLDGDVDALMVPHPTQAILESPDRVGRLFGDLEAEETAYVRTRGYFPIMHLVGIRNDVVGEHPWLAGALFEAFNKATGIAKRHYDDPNWSILAWGRHQLERERAIFGEVDPWRNGVAANRVNLEQFVGYSFDQGLIRRRLAVDELFLPDLLST